MKRLLVFVGLLTLAILLCWGITRAQQPRQAGMDKQIADLTSAGWSFHSSIASLLKTNEVLESRFAALEKQNADLQKRLAELEKVSPKFKIETIPAPGNSRICLATGLGDCVYCVENGQYTNCDGTPHKEKKP